MKRGNVIVITVSIVLTITNIVAAKRAGGKDNVTAILIDWEKIT